MSKLADIFILGFYSDTLFSAIQSLEECRPLININVVHNHSSRAHEINSKLGEMLEAGTIDTVSYFHENIAAAAFEAVFLLRCVRNDAPYTIITDGDLLPSPGWLEEHVRILERNNDVFSVSTRLSMHNAPGAIPSMVASTAEHEDYIEQRTGWVLKTFRTSEWREYLSFAESSKIMFHDNEVYQWARNYQKQKSVVTRNATATHLRWDFLDDETYNREKRALGDPWYHDKTSLVTVKRKTGVSRYSTLPRRRHRLQSWRRLLIKNKSEHQISIELVVLGIDGKHYPLHIKSVEAFAEVDRTLYSAKRVSIWAHRDGDTVFTGEYEVDKEIPEIEIR